MDKQFTMSMYASGEALYKAKAEYYMDEIAALKASNRELIRACKGMVRDLNSRGAKTHNVLLAQQALSSNPNTKLYKAQGAVVEAAKKEAEIKLPLSGESYYGQLLEAVATLERIEQEMK